MRIAKADILVHRVPIEIPVRTSFGTMTDRPSVLIRLEDEDGRAGWGEVWCNYPTVGAEHRARLLQSVVLPMLFDAGAGIGPSEFWRLATKQLEVLAIQTGEYGPIAQCLSGLECAMTDLAARQANLPLWRYLNGDGNPSIGVYASGINPDDAVATVGQALKSGHRACKLKVGFGFEIDRGNLIDIRNEFGRSLVLMADANQKWTLDEARSMLGLLEDARAAWIEEPLRHDAPDEDWVSLSSATRTLMAAGENFTAQADFRFLPERRGLSVVQPDIGKWGGILEAIDVARFAADKGLRFCPHWLGGGIGLLASLHAKAAVGGGDYVEVDFNANAMRARIADFVLDQMKFGIVTLPEDAGIGPVEERIAEFSSLGTWSDEMINSKRN